MTLEATTLFKSFGAIRALSDVSFAVGPGEIKGLCGENGAGKSTLVKILTGVYQPDAGSITVAGRARQIRDPQAAQELGIAFVSQELSIPPHLSVFDNIWLGHRATPFLHRRRALRERAREILRLVGLDHLSLDRSASSLSLGERQLLEIARALVRDARILFLDEPTATLSNHEIQLVFTTLRRLRDHGTSIVLITHRLSEIFELCDTVAVLRNGRAVASRKVEGSSRKELIELMLGHPLDQMYPARAAPSSKLAMTVRGLRVPGAFSDLSFDLQDGQIICLAGQIGSGAPDALRALAGLIYDAEGQVEAHGCRLRLGSVPRSMAAGLIFVSDDRAAEGLFLKMPVLDNLAALWMQKTSGGPVLDLGDMAAIAARTADSVGVDVRRLPSRASDLSGGNQQKIAIGRASIAADRAILLMNEPTRGVDVGARAEIYRQMRRLCDGGFSIIMASTDIEEVVGIADVVITMFRGAAVALYRGAEIARNQVLADIVHQGHDATEVAQ